MPRSSSFGAARPELRTIAPQSVYVLAPFTLNISRAQRELGYQPIVTWQGGIAAMGARISNAGRDHGVRLPSSARAVQAG